MRRLESRDWWPDLLELKDQLSLRELAERFDVTPGAISAALKRTGVGRKHAPPGPRAYRQKRKQKREQQAALPPEAGSDTPRPRSKDALLQAQEHLLGQIPDTEVARQLDISARTVANYRSRKGIPAFQGTRSPSDVVVPSNGSQAWKVTIRSGGIDVTRVVIGRDLVDAASRARDAQLGGQVVGLSLVGAVL